MIQARTAQLVAYRLGTGEVPGSNPKGDNFSVKISHHHRNQLAQASLQGRLLLATRFEGLFNTEEFTFVRPAQRAGIGH